MKYGILHSVSFSFFHAEWDFLVEVGVAVFKRVSDFELTEWKAEQLALRVSKTLKISHGWDLAGNITGNFADRHTDLLYSIQINNFQAIPAAFNIPSKSREYWVAHKQYLQPK